MSTVKLEGAQRAAALAQLQMRGWAEHPQRDAITKTFAFKDFTQAFAWMTKIALIAEKMDHHPEWTNIYNRVEATLTTHDCGGLSAKDTALAQHMDAPLG